MGEPFSFTTRQSGIWLPESDSVNDAVIPATTIEISVRWPSQLLLRSPNAAVSDTRHARPIKRAFGSEQLSSKRVESVQSHFSRISFSERASNNQSRNAGVFKKAKATQVKEHTNIGYASLSIRNLAHAKVTILVAKRAGYFFPPHKRWISHERIEPALLDHDFGKLKRPMKS